MTDIVTSKFRLPDIQSLEIEDVSEKHESVVNSFLTDWAPNHFNDFKFKWKSNYNSMVNSRLFMDSFIKVFPWVTSKISFQNVAF